MGLLILSDKQSFRNVRRRRNYELRKSEDKTMCVTGSAETLDSQNSNLTLGLISILKQQQQA